MTKHNPKKQLLESLYSRYSTKKYELPKHIFNILKRKYRRQMNKKPKNIHSARWHFSEGRSRDFILEPIVFVCRDKLLSNEFLSVHRPKRNKLLQEDEFFVGYSDDEYELFFVHESIDRFVLIKIPHEIQFIFCLKAAPIK